MGKGSTSLRTTCHESLRTTCSRCSFCFYVQMHPHCLGVRTFRHECTGIPRGCKGRIHQLHLCFLWVLTRTHHISHCAEGGSIACLCCTEEGSVACPLSRFIRWLPSCIFQLLSSNLCQGSLGPSFSYTNSITLS